MGIGFYQQVPQYRWDIPTMKRLRNRLFKLKWTKQEFVHYLYSTALAKVECDILGWINYRSFRSKEQGVTPWLVIPLKNPCIKNRGWQRSVIFFYPSLLLCSFVHRQIKTFGMGWLVVVVVGVTPWLVIMSLTIKGYFTILYAMTRQWRIEFEGAYSMRWRLQSYQRRIEFPRNK